MKKNMDMKKKIMKKEMNEVKMKKNVKKMNMKKMNMGGRRHTNTDASFYIAGINEEIGTVMDRARCLPQFPTNLWSLTPPQGSAYSNNSSPMIGQLEP